MPNLDTYGPLLKVTRAKRHIRDLQSLIDSFIGDNPHRIEFHEDDDGVEIVSVFDRPLPNETATIIGDAIHNLRVALDHLAAQAVKAGGQEPSRNTGFPIYKAEVDFDGGITSKLSGAPDAFIDFVKGLKPYRAAKDGSAGNTQLWALSQLDNLDKHLVLLPTISVLTVKNVRIITPQGGGLTIGQLEVSGNGKIARMAGKGAEYHADPDAIFSVSFTNTKLVDGENVIGVLSELEKGVSHIIADAAQLSF